MPISKFTFDANLIKQKIIEKGQDGFIMLLQTLKEFDKTSKNSIILIDYRKALKQFKLVLHSNDVDSSFATYDTDNDGRTDIIALLQGIRGNMNEKRKELAKMVFKSIAFGGENVTFSLLKEKYNPKLHPAVMEGRKTMKECLEEFISSFQLLHSIQFNSKEVIDEAEFVEYYEYISACISKEDYYEAMMNNVWGMDPNQKPMMLTSPIKTSLYGPNTEEIKIESKSDLSKMFSNK